MPVDCKCVVFLIALQMNALSILYGLQFSNDSSTDCSNFIFPVMLGLEGACLQDCASVMGQHL